jgi:hypothetical protein
MMILKLLESMLLILNVNLASKDTQEQLSTYTKL